MCQSLRRLHRSELYAYSLRFIHTASGHTWAAATAVTQREGDRSSTGDLERLYSLTGDLLRLAALPLHEPLRVIGCVSSDTHNLRSDSLSVHGQHDPGSSEGPTCVSAAHVIQQ